MHFDIEAKRRSHPMFSIIDYAFLRSYQPHQINTLFRYIPCTKRRASRNSCQPQTGTQASKKTDLIVSSSWYFHFYISFENLVTFTRRQCHIRVGYIRDCVCFGRKSLICKNVGILENRRNTAISCAFKVASKKRIFLAITLHIWSHRTK